VRQSNIYKRFRHRISLWRDARENSTFTGFCRLPTQFEALADPVVGFLLKDEADRKLRIIVFGCSNGAEAYTVSSILHQRCSGLNFKVFACDIDSCMIEKAKTACYQTKEIYNNKIIRDSFINFTFNQDGNRFKVKEEIAKSVCFEKADALDTGLKNSIGPADILFAQNFLFHMKPKASLMALRNLCGLLKPKAVLFIDGVDINIRKKITKRLKLEPLDYKIKEIHNEAMRARAVGWPYSYWGLEPFMTSSKNWRRRYATIFKKGS